MVQCSWGGVEKTLQSMWSRSLGCSCSASVHWIKVASWKSLQAVYHDVTVWIDAVGLVTENDFYDFR